MSKQRLLILSFSDISSDARVLKQVRLFAEDYKIVTCSYGAQPAGSSEHYQIPDEAGYWLYSRSLIMLRRYSAAYWSNPAVTAGMRLLADVQVDAVLANDIDSIGLALRVHSTHGVHADLHEYSPRQKEELRRWKWFFAPFVRWMCREFVLDAESVTTVSDGIAREYQQQFGISATTVTNASPYAQLSPTPVTSPIRLVHSGIAARERQLEILIKATQNSRTHVELDLYLMPVDQGYLQELETLANKSPEKIRIRPPVANAELIEILNQHDVGLHVLPPTSFNNAWALPNKFFDYVQARLGLIIGPSPEMQAILEKIRAGAVCRDFGATTLTEQINSLDVRTVEQWKKRSHDSALELSAHTQLEGWKQPIDRLMARRSEDTTKESN